jgi:DNA invertase Pin-like site-specific DNA recombinase
MVTQDIDSPRESIMKVVGYGRCSTAEQAAKGVSIEVQRRAVERVAESNGWDLTWLADEGVSGGVPPESRKRFRAALALLEVGKVGALIFTNVDRASRCTEDFARLIRLSEEQGWRLIVTEMGIDTRTPMGKAMAHMALVFAELERDFIRSRTREALAVRRDHGVVLGRPRSTPDDVVARVVRERTDGKTAYAIARDLNKDAVPTAQCARAWSQATVRALLIREGVH